MPTLTPKPHRHYLRSGPFSLLVKQLAATNNDSGGDQHHASSRLDYVDSLRGLMAVLVVVYHFRCAFDPCSVFGPSTRWTGDATECTAGGSVVLYTLTNGSFAVAVFFVLSGMILSHGLWKSKEVYPWRIAVAKRFLRLCIPVSVSLLISYMLAGQNSHKEVASITNSLWLVHLAPTRPSPVTGLVSQMLWGVWKSGGGTLNNAIWTMRYELMGSYMTFGLVQLLKRLPHTTRSRWLGGLFLLFLLPWPHHESKVKVHVQYEQLIPLPGEPGQKRVTKTLMKEVILDPLQHSHTLQHMQDLMDASGHRGSSRFAVQFLDETSIDVDDSNDAEDDTKQRQVFHLDQNSQNPLIYHDLMQAAGALMHRDKGYTAPRLEFRQRSVWTYHNGWLWYAAFVGGMWISEARLSTPRLKQPHKGSVFLWILPAYLKAPILAYVAPLFALLCASYPYTAVGAVNNQSSFHFLWRTMLAMAKSVGYPQDEAQFFWCILGAFALVNHIVLYSRPMRRFLATNAVLQWLGRISFSLYLVHIPLLYSVSCTVFMRYYHGHLWHDDAFGSSVWAFAFSFPVMLASAFVFSKTVDTPAMMVSGPLAEWLLGYNNSNNNAAPRSEATDASQKEEEQGKGHGIPTSLPLLDETEFSETSS